MTNLNFSIEGQPIGEVATFLKANVFGVELAIRNGAKTYQDVQNYLIGEMPTKKEQRSARIVPLKQGRNDICPCQSGKKFKHCCGR